MPLDDHHSKLKLGALAAAIGMASGGVSAAEYVVETTASSGEGSLADAISQANSNEGDDTITITATGTIDLSEATLPAHTDGVGTLTINGPGMGKLTLRGPNLEIPEMEAMPASRMIGPFYSSPLLRSEASTALTISGMTVSRASFGAVYAEEGSTVNLDSVRITGTDLGAPPLLRVDEGASLTITDSVIDKNTGAETLISASEANLTLSGTEISGNDTFGGVASLYDVNASISNSVISGNEIPEFEFEGPIPFDRAGGPASEALFRAEGSTLTITDTAFIKNRSKYVGGALSVDDTDLTVTGSSFDRNSAKYAGGAIFADGESSLTIENSSFVDNELTADEGGEGGGAIHFANYSESAGEISVSGSLFSGNKGGSGGAIQARGVSEFSLTDSVVSDNSAGSTGGVAVSLAYEGSFDLIGTSIDGNTSTYGAAGLDVRGDSLAANISQSSISNNTALVASEGVGVSGFRFRSDSYEGSTSLTIAQSTISGNQGDGKAVDLRFQNEGSYYEGTLYGFNGEGSLSIENSTFSGNVSNNARAPIEIEGFQETDVTHSTFINNEGAGVYSTQVHFASGNEYYNSNTLDVTLTRSVFSSANDAEAIFNAGYLNISGTYENGTDDVDVTIVASLFSQGTVSLGEGATSVTGEGIGGDPGLGELANNGGPTLTHAPIDGTSVVVDFNEGGSRPDGVDQRGVAFTDGDADLGAVEYVDPSQNTAPTVRQNLGKQLSGKVGLVLPEPIPVAAAFEDAEEDNITVVSVTGLPGGLEFNEGSISGELAVPGEFVVKVTVEDDGSPALSTTATFEVKVSEGGLSNAELAALLDDDDDDFLGGTPLPFFGTLAALAWLRRRRR